MPPQNAHPRSTPLNLVYKVRLVVENTLINNDKWITSSENRGKDTCKFMDIQYAKTDKRGDFLYDDDVSENNQIIILVGIIGLYFSSLCMVMYLISIFTVDILLCI